MEDSDCILGKKIQRPRSRNSEVNGTQMLSPSSLAGGHWPVRGEREREIWRLERQAGWGCFQRLGGRRWCISTCAEGRPYFFVGTGFLHALNF